MSNKRASKNEVRYKIWVFLKISFDFESSSKIQLDRFSRIFVTRGRLIDVLKWGQEVMRSLKTAFIPLWLIKTEKNVRNQILNIKNDYWLIFRTPSVGCLPICQILRLNTSKTWTRPSKELKFCKAIFLKILFHLT